MYFSGLVVNKRGLIMTSNNSNTLVEVLPVKFNSKIKLSWFECFKYDLKNRFQISHRILHTTELHPASVLIIGSGQRVRQNFLPALHCLDRPLKIIGIYSRNYQHAYKLASQWGVSALAALDSNLLDSIDIIVVSITPQSVPGILKKISELTQTENKILIIDTPVFAGLRNIMSSYLLHQYANVIVTEDYMNFPQFKIIRDFLQEGRLGKVKKIEINHIGYKYHGLALARSLLGFPLVKSVKYQSSSLHYDLEGGEKIIVTEPYQKLDGYLRVTGEEGTLLYSSHNKHDYFVAGIDATYILTEHYKDNDFFSFLLIKRNLREFISAELFKRISSLKQYQQNDFNTFKTMGLVDVIDSAFSCNVNSQYGFVNGLYDNYISNLAYKRLFRLPVLKCFYNLIRFFSGIKHQSYKEIS